MVNEKEPSLFPPCAFFRIPPTPFVVYTFSDCERTVPPRGDRKRGPLRAASRRVLPFFPFIPGAKLIGCFLPPRVPFEVEKRPLFFFFFFFFFFFPPQSPVVEGDRLFCLDRSRPARRATHNGPGLFADGSAFFPFPHGPSTPGISAFSSFPVSRESLSLPMLRRRRRRCFRGGVPFSGPRTAGSTAGRLSPRALEVISPPFLL